MRNLDQIIEDGYNDGSWPRPGTKVKYLGVPEFYYPCFTCYRERANKLLKEGEVYTVSKTEVYSSWCQIWLEEIPEDPDRGFHLVFFEMIKE